MTTTTTQSPQAIFDAKFATVDVERYGEYGRLVYSLEEVFKAYGYDIPGEELAGSQHNHICGSIGQTDITVIAKSFLGWVTPSGRFDYVTEQVASGTIASYSYGIWRDPTINPATLVNWAEQVKAAMKKEGVRRNSKRYQAFIQEKAHKVIEPFRQAAREAIEAKKADVERKRAEVVEDNRKAQDTANHLMRTAYIVKAFCRISGLDDGGKIEALQAAARRIERGISSRMSRIDSILGGLNDCDINEVVSDSVSAMPDLRALWEAASK